MYAEDEVKHLLNSLVEIDNLSLLLVGSPGVGKTTAIEVIIHDYFSNNNSNNNSNKHSSVSTNILYLNCLMEQGIHFYRNYIKTFCQTRSTIQHRKKIVVLDDIDTISDACQQALRNIIDKYSHNVHFIASCCAPQKISDSIQSRLLTIRLQGPSDIASRLIMNRICKAENIIIDPIAKDFILAISQNNAKIIVTYLEKCKLIGCPITAEMADEACTNIPFAMFDDYIGQLVSGNITEALRTLYIISDKGYSVMDILDNLFIYLKSTCTLEDNMKLKMVPIICEYIGIFHNVHEDEIELAFLTNDLFLVLRK